MRKKYILLIVFLGISILTIRHTLAEKNADNIFFIIDSNIIYPGAIGVTKNESENFVDVKYIVSLNYPSLEMNDFFREKLLDNGWVILKRDKGEPDGVSWKAYYSESKDKIREITKWWVKEDHLIAFSLKYINDDNEHLHVRVLESITDMDKLKKFAGQENKSPSDKNGQR